MTFREAVRKALYDEMSENRDTVLLGEDVGIYGGCFKVTESLKKNFPDQVLDTPVSEEGFAGMAVGAAMMGLRPVVEIMYADFFTLISDAVVNHAAKAHFMSGGQFSCPVTFRLPEGSGTGHGPQHTQSPEAMFMNVTGLKIVCPSNPSDAYHLLRASIKDNNPVLFFEHKMLYPTEGEISDRKTEIGKANVLMKGNDLTIISYSHAVLTALETAKILKDKGISSTVVDLCTIKPLDRQTILYEVQNTKRAVVIQDPPAFGGVASHVCSLIATDEKTFSVLKNPVLQIGGQNSPVPFSKTLEQDAVPNVNGCVNQILNWLK